MLLVMQPRKSFHSFLPHFLYFLIKNTATDGASLQSSHKFDEYGARDGWITVYPEPMGDADPKEQV